MKEKVVIICGPTASGKTALSIELAKKINGEIISADSMQIYKDMNIGTAKPTCEEMQGIKHYLLDFVSPEERYSVAQYKKDAKIAIKDIISKIDALKSKIYDYEKEKSNLAKEIEALDEKNTQVSNFIKENESKISSLRTSEDFKEKVYKTVIPRNIKLSEAPSAGICIFDYDGSSVGAQAYKELAKEVLSRNG